MERPRAQAAVSSAENLAKKIRAKNDAAIVSPHSRRRLDIASLHNDADANPSSRSEVSSSPSQMKAKSTEEVDSPLVRRNIHQWGEH